MENELAAKFRALLNTAPRRSFRRGHEYADSRLFLMELGIDPESAPAKQVLHGFAQDLQQRRSARTRRFFNRLRRCLASIASPVLIARLGNAISRFAKQLIKDELRRRNAPKWQSYPFPARTIAITEAERVFTGDHGPDTKQFLRKLEDIAPFGTVAAQLFRCQKSSCRAKRYRGRPPGGNRSYREYAYDAKQSALAGLVRVLGELDGALRWGWKLDPETERNPWVVYVDLPNGQVSFHSPTRGDGPNYAGEWDGSYSSENRIIELCNAICAQLQIA